MTSRLFLIVLSFLPFVVNAQLTKECFNSNGELVDEAQSEYCVVGKRVLRIEKGLGYVDSVLTYSDTVTAYYTSDKKIKSLKIYNSNGLEHGNYIEYYPNLKLKEVGRSVEGNKDGTIITYHPDGKMRASLQYFSPAQIVTDNPNGNYKVIAYRDESGNTIVNNGNGYCDCVFDGTIREKGKVVDGLRDSIWTFYQNEKVVMVEYYRQGKFVEGTRYDDQTPFHYTRLKEPAQYIDGNDVLFETLFRNWSQPGACWGPVRVEVAMIISASGEIENPRVIKGKNAKCDQEIIKLLGVLKKFYPARQRGKPIAARYILPIHLNQF